MKIEKVNENQIRCTLTKQDLEERQIKMSELAYGSDKARDLFKDMIKQANHQFGFEAGDIPLMIEAIPLPTESIILVITKVESPDELDTRFSRFTEDDDEDYDDEEEYSVEEERSESEEAHELFKPEEGSTKPEEETTNVDVVKMYEFSSLDAVRALAKVMVGVYEGENDLYKHPRNGKFYLLMHKSEYAPEQFNKICNQIAEYASQKRFQPSIKAFFEEHGKAIVIGNALETIATL